MKFTFKKKVPTQARSFAFLPVKLDCGTWILFEWFYYEDSYTWGSSWTNRWQGERIKSKDLSVVVDYGYASEEAHNKITLIEEFRKKKCKE